MKTVLQLHSHPSSRAFLLAGLAALFLRSAALADDTRVILAIDMSPEGKTVPVPSQAHPTYYYPIYTGYEEMGAVLKFYERKPKSEDEIHRSLAVALARQGYLIATNQCPPTIALDFRWGTIAPQRLPKGYILQQLPPRMSLHERPRSVVMNADEIRTYILGAGWRDVNRHDPNGKEMLSLTPRHFLVISALDFKAFAQQKELLLWRAHASTNVGDNYLDEVMRPLIAAAAPRLGQETNPEIVWTPAVASSQAAPGNQQVATLSSPPPMAK